MEKTKADRDRGQIVNKKELVGQTAANIRKVRIPEPYHGYGIRYKGEYVEHKEGKTSGKGKK